MLVFQMIRSSRFRVCSYEEEDDKNHGVLHLSSSRFRVCSYEEVDDKNHGVLHLSSSRSRVCSYEEDDKNHGVLHLSSSIEASKVFLFSCSLFSSSIWVSS